MRLREILPLSIQDQKMNIREIRSKAHMSYLNKCIPSLDAYKIWDVSLIRLYGSIISPIKFPHAIYVDLTDNTTNNTLKSAIPENCPTSRTNQKGLLMSINEPTTYVRAINDYSLSLHEVYNKHLSSSPVASTIVSIRDCSFKKFNILLDAINAYMQAEPLIKDYKTVIRNSIHFHDDPAEAYSDDFSIRAQTIELYTSDIGKTTFAVELIGTDIITNITFLSNNKELCDNISNKLLDDRPKFRSPVSKTTNTFYTISQTNRGFELEDLDIKNKSNIEELFNNYNDDFKDADEVIRNLIDENKKGLILLHGIPGSGKTSYIKYLITRESHRKIVYIPTHLTSSIANPAFVSFVKRELTNAVLVIEDAEQVLITRESMESSKEAVSNILQLTDGLISDAINTLLICTFNTDMKYIDKALTRKGRLMLDYKFDLLNVSKTNKMMESLYGIIPNKEMSLADIYNYDYNLITPKEAPKVTFGFGKHG